MSPLNHSPSLYLVLLLYILLPIKPSQNSQPYTPIDLILINCGESSNSTSLDGRNWIGDVRSKFTPGNSDSSSSAFEASQPDSSVDQVPFGSARVINSNFSYTFPVSPGPKFVRLYFYPTKYSSREVSESFFSVHANGFTLLSNFSAFLTVSAATPRVVFIIKEYIVTVLETEKLIINFSPSPGSFAFINGIEIVSMPNNLYERVEDPFIPFVGTGDLYQWNTTTTALETVHRLNVGGRDIGGVYDTGMFRTWYQDQKYIASAQSGFVVVPRINVTINYTKDTPAYTAPEEVYRTLRSMGPYPEINKNYNLTWNFPVDSGFTYLLRLHFCNSLMEITRMGDIIFFIYINNETAESNADVLNWSGGKNIPVFRDYVVNVLTGDSSLCLALHPNIDLKPNYPNAILNGLEIFKLSDTNGILAGPNPEPGEAFPTPPPQMHPGKLEKTSSRKRLRMVLMTVGAVFGGILMVSLIVCFFVSKRRTAASSEKGTDGKSFWMPFSFTSRSITTKSTTSQLPSELCRQFSIFEIEIATDKFDDQNIVGAGGFGNVYKGFIDDGATPVAIKRLNSTSTQGAREFRMEIELLSNLRHLHLVSLIGYCDDPGEMILVYEYMHHGTLRDHLYKTKNPPLSWKKRLEICIGAAKGLHYLHTGTKNMIIHRDVKSTNILLDNHWVAKVSDFGLSRTGLTTSETHVSTVVRGSFGYVDPEYFRRQKLTEKSDVYSFGVVLFEILCARPPVIPGLPKEQISLAEWGQNCFEKDKLERIIDPNLKGLIAPMCLKKFGEIASSCVKSLGIERPTMGDVVWGLEFALQLQETAERSNRGGERDGHVEEIALMQRTEEAVATTDDEEEDDIFSCSNTGSMSKSRSTFNSSSGGTSGGGAHFYSDRLKSENVFSEIMDPKGR